MQKTSKIDFRPQEPQISSCPSCESEIVADQKECFSCGIIFKNFEKFQFESQIKSKIGGIEHLSTEALRTLDHRWKRLVVNYHDNDAHQAFVRRCLVEEAMPFAVHCYTKMLEIDKEDDIAVVMRKQALRMLTVRMESTKVTDEDSKPKSSGVFKWVVWLGLFFSSVVVLMGIFIPQMHNLVGLGVSLLFLFIFAQVYRSHHFS